VGVDGTQWGEGCISFGSRVCRSSNLRCRLLARIPSGAEALRREWELNVRAETRTLHRLKLIPVKGRRARESFDELLYGSCGGRAAGVAGAELGEAGGGAGCGWGVWLDQKGRQASG
jgi:hypothetical protein